MNNNINVPIMGVTTKHKEYEQRIINDLRKQLLNDKSKINLIDVSVYDTIGSNNDFQSAIQTIKENNNRVIFLTDANVGKTDEYKRAAKKLFENNIRPFVLVTHVEAAQQDLESVALLPASLSEEFSDYYDYYHYMYDYLFFNYETGKFFVEEGGGEEGIRLFAELLIVYVQDKYYDREDDFER